MISIRRTEGCHDSCLWKKDYLDYIDTYLNYGGSIYQVMCNASEVYRIGCTIHKQTKLALGLASILGPKSQTRTRKNIFPRGLALASASLASITSTHEILAKNDKIYILNFNLYLRC